MKLKDYLNIFLRDFPVFKPNNHIVTIFDMIYGCLVLLNFIIIPFNICFDAAFYIRNELS